MYKCIHFNVKELVHPHTYAKFGENSWMFFDRTILEDIDTIRETWGMPLIINNGSTYTESGLRDNLCKIVKDKKDLYLSAHLMGKAFDLKDKLGRNAKLFSHVCSLIQKGKLKAIKRVENPITAPTWVHVDSFQTPDGKLQVFMG